MAGLAVSLLLAGCASSPDRMETAYVSPLQYKDHDCDQIAAELARVTRRANELHGRLKKKADGDVAQMAVGMVLFWPALFFLEGGDGPDATEYSRLKGERDTLEALVIQKKCAAGVEPSHAPAGSESSDGGVGASLLGATPVRVALQGTVYGTR